MYQSYNGFPSHAPTQCLFDTNIGMMRTFSTFAKNGYALKIFKGHKQTEF